MKIISFIRIILAGLLIFNFQSCNTQNATSVSNNNLTLVEQIIISGVDQGLSILENPDSFLNNALIEAVMPEELKKINNQLERIGLGELVEKEKLYISKAAQASAEIARPIISSAVKEITTTDVISILRGEKGAATQYIKSKTEAKLIEIIQVQVENQLNSQGIISLINNAINNKTVQNTLGIILGNDAVISTDSGSSISKYASQQIVNGLFEVAREYEIRNSDLTKDAIDRLLKK